MVRCNHADIAHLEEHLSCKEDVEGSSPSVGSKCTRCNGSGTIMRLSIPYGEDDYQGECPKCLGNGIINADILKIIEKRKEPKEIIMKELPKIRIKECNFCHGSGLALIRGKKGMLDVVYCPECFGNGYKEVE